ncbi:hypothetical protein [Bacteroides reticulotermitis]|uniref:hypothetical protein n=1 Tax=Bacteroides reticulotermitis TaxID=1133319 RepID=UPI003A8567E1
MADLLINGKDAFAIWGVRPDKGFIAAIDTPVPAKEPVENKSRLEDGKRVILVEALKIDERDINLPFAIKANSSADYRTKKNAFIQEIMSGEVIINIPSIGSQNYHLYYKNSTSFESGLSSKACRFSVKFCEYNPGNRE